MVQLSTEEPDWNSFPGSFLDAGWRSHINSSFEDVIQQHLSYLQWFARKYLDENGSYTADDLVGDTIYRAYLAWPRDPIVEPLAWLCTILVNTFRSHVKRRVTLRTILSSLDLRDEHRWVLGTEMSDYDDAETVLSYAEDIASLNALFNQLHPTYRKIIIEHAIFGEGYEQLANEHTTVETLRTRMHRATIRFVQLVKERNIPEQDLRRWFLVYYISKRW